MMEIMTTNMPPNPPQQPQQQPQPQYAPPQPAPSKPAGLAITALVTGIVAFVLWWVPVLGVIVGIVAVVFGVLALVKKQSKGFGLTGLILGALGLVAALILSIVLAMAANEAVKVIDESAEKIAPSESQEPVDEAEEEQPASEEGTRANPYPIGTDITDGDWTVTINSVNLDAAAAIKDENIFNEEPDPGTVYILVNMTATYNGTAPEGASPWTSVEYVTVDGNTITNTDKFIIAPSEFDASRTLYEGASITGNKALQVPADTAGEGVLAVKPGLLSDKHFVAVQ